MAVVAEDEEVVGAPPGSCLDMNGYHSACAEGQIGALGDMDGGIGGDIDGNLDGNLDGDMDGETCPSLALMMEKPQNELGQWHFPESSLKAE